MFVFRDCNAVGEMKRFIDAHFRDPITIHDVSKRFGYTPYHCNWLFEKFYGETFAAYLRRIRMETAKKELAEGKSVAAVAKAISYGSPEGFNRAFRAQYGISPIQWVRGATPKKQYLAKYEFYEFGGDWGSGNNPTSDGLMEYGCYDPRNNEYRLMEWTGRRFEAPCLRQNYSDPAYYCCNRSGGCGMHPGKIVQAVRTFICPHDGTLEFFLSVGRFNRVYLGKTPCSIRLLFNEKPLIPEKGEIVLRTSIPAHLKGTITVKKGDRIQLFLDSMGDVSYDAVYLYVQRFFYTDFSDRSI